MRILMLSWEYPPKAIGGLAEHVSHLSRELCRLGDEVHVITCECDAPPRDYDRGVFVHRVSPIRLQSDDFIKWIMHLNFSIIARAIQLTDEFGRFDVIHAHDWMTMYSATTLKGFNIPMVCTIHSTEHGRNNGVWTDVQRTISSAEWTLTYEAWKVVTCGMYMRHQVCYLFQVPWEKVWVIPNGVDPAIYDFEFDHRAFRNRFAMDHEKLVFFIGRHVYEKGLHVLAEASWRINHEAGPIRFVVAGAGPMTDEVRNRVHEMGLGDRFVFPGYIDLDTKKKLYRVADAAVFPSLYEPFGIVALEAMAAGCPVVVSDTGGLGELIRHGVNGLKTYTGIASSLADNVIRVLRDEGLARSMKRNASQTVHDAYTWDKVAQLTKKLYQAVKSEENSVRKENAPEISVPFS